MVSMRACLFVFARVFLPLWLGALIYVGWRSTSLRLFGWLEHAGVLELALAWRTWVKTWPYTLPEWVRYSLPDGLWLFAYLSCLRWIWRKDWRRGWLWFVISVGLAVGTELAQALHWLPGTFDIIDVLVYVLAALFACIPVLPGPIFNLNARRSKLFSESS